jgi:hypothetical protein
MGNKRGQIAIFIIIGLILIIGVGTVVYVVGRGEKTNTIVEDTARNEDPSTQLQGIVTECYRSQSIPYLRKLSEKGGTLKEPFIVHRGQPYSVYCQEVDGKGCINLLRTKRDIAEEFDTLITPLVDGCIDLAPLEKKGFTVVSRGTLAISSIIGFDDVTSELTIPIKLKRGQDTISFDQLAQRTQSPIGKLHSLALLLLNQEIQNGYMDKDSWMKQHGAGIKINIDRPYPNTVIELNTTDNVGRQYFFRVAQSGLSTADKPLEPRRPVTYLQNCNDGFDCYFNAPASLCTSKKGIVVEANDSRCVPPFVNETKCNGKACKSCDLEGTILPHGKQWCGDSYHRKNGLDLVGSRFVKLSCIDGEIIEEPCRDYREEFCVEDGEVAGCRDNRWQDCWSQASVGQCENTTVRDCFWRPGFVPPPPTEVAGRNSDRCNPIVGPGLQHWTASGKLVCQVGNEQMHEDIGVFSQALSWKPPVAHANAMAQWCYSLGDCGNKVNMAEFGPNKRFKSSTGKPSKSYMTTTLDEIIKAPKVPLNIPAFQGVKADNFNYPQGDPDYMKDRTREYINWWLSQDPIAVLMDMVPLWIRHSTHCKLYKAPVRLKKQRCEMCADALGGCSEYLCKSLGRKCVFSNDNGFPKCVVKGTDTQLDITIEFPGRNVQATSSGYRVVEPLNPWEMLNISVKTDSEATCMLSMIPGFTGSLESDDPETESALGGAKIFFDYMMESFSPGSNAFNPDLREPAKSQDLLFEVPDTSQFNSMTTGSKAASYFANPFETKSLFDSVFSFATTDPRAQVNLQKAKDAWGEPLSSALKENKQFNTLGNKVDLLLTFNALRKVPTELRLYLSCDEDEEGTTTKQIVIEVAIRQDNIPVRVLNVTPAPPAAMPSSLKLLLSEPAECAFSLDNDKTFDEMTAMKCDMRGVGTRQCETETGVSGPHTVYVKCRDRPFAFYHGLLKITTTGQPEATGGVLSPGEDINFTVSPFMMTQTITYPATKASTKFTVNTPSNYICKYGPAIQSFDKLPSGMTCTDSHCETQLDTNGEKSYAFICADSAGSYQNENPESFIYAYS